MPPDAVTSRLRPGGGPAGELRQDVQHDGLGGLARGLRRPVFRTQRPPAGRPVAPGTGDRGFDEVAFDAPPTEASVSVGVNRLARPSAATPPDGRLFTFRSS